MHAQDVPMLINYQAKLVGNNDAPITGTVAVTFRMYDALTSGNLIWTETHSSLSSNNGIISVLLGSVPVLRLTTLKNPQKRHLFPILIFGMSSC